MTQRTILFRGKSENYGWIEGFYLKNHEGECFIQNIDIHGYAKIEVDTATVGQFTGLTDKNGVNIFEGDIINCIDHNGTLRREIVFNKLDYFAFGWSTQSVSTHIGIGWEMEVIGNIHDNPELI